MEGEGRERIRLEEVGMRRYRSGGERGGRIG